MNKYRQLWPSGFWIWTLVVSLVPTLIFFMLGSIAGAIWRDLGHGIYPLRWGGGTAFVFLSIWIPCCMWDEFLLIQHLESDAMDVVERAVSRARDESKGR